jgi:hypothetical protein
VCVVLCSQSQSREHVIIAADLVDAVATAWGLTASVLQVEATVSGNTQTYACVATFVSGDHLLGRVFFFFLLCGFVYRCEFGLVGMCAPHAFVSSTSIAHSHRDSCHGREW